MSDKSIETESFEDSVVIEEPIYGLSSFYALFKRGSNTGAYLGFFLFLCILPIVIPYVFYGSYFNLYLIGLGLLAIDTFYLANNRKYSDSHVKLQTFVTSLVMIILVGCGLRAFNFDKHVQLDYYNRSAEYPTDIMKKDIEDPFIGDTKSFTISVKPTSFKFKGPDFGGLAGEVRSGSKEYLKGSLEDFKPFTLYYGSDAQGKTGDIKGKRTVYGWFGSTSTNFVIELEK